MASIGSGERPLWPPAELTAKGYRLIHDARTEPWTQITARLLSPEGLLIAVCYTPSFHETPHS